MESKRHWRLTKLQSQLGLTFVSLAVSDNRLLPARPSSTNSQSQSYSFVMIAYCGRLVVYIEDLRSPNHDVQDQVVLMSVVKSIKSVHYNEECLTYANLARVQLAQKSVLRSSLGDQKAVEDRLMTQLCHQLNEACPINLVVQLEMIWVASL